MFRLAPVIAVLLASCAHADSARTRADRHPAEGEDKGKAEVSQCRTATSDSTLHLEAATLANNAFYYYRDLDRAERFYTQTLGFELTADYGFAKILRVAPSSYLTLVDAAKGMHGADEPKTVTLAIVTDDLEAWNRRLLADKVPMRHPYEGPKGGAHDGFVAVDPEGYLLEFERFNAHPENEQLRPVLDEIEALRGHRPEGLGVLATVLWLYYDDLDRAHEYYREQFQFDTIVDQGWAKIMRSSATGFVGLVDGARGLHRATSIQGVTASFFVRDVDSVFQQLCNQSDFRFKHERIGIESDAVRTFVGFDPGGYYLEFDTFMTHPRNAELLANMSCEGTCATRSASDLESYRLGSIAAFSEMVGAGVKTLALGAPVSAAEAQRLLEKARPIAQRYGVELHVESDFLVTDLFPESATKDKHVLMIYRGATLEAYQALKAEKAALLSEGAYRGAAREAIARRMGQLLSYPKDDIDRRLHASPPSH